MADALNQHELDQLNQNLYFLHISELKDICHRLNLPPAGRKLDLITRIMSFLRTGKVAVPPMMPEISKAKKGHEYPLTPKAKMLLGSYKNDLKTRKFMKTLVGEHFHFTAYGQDWLKVKWLAGEPPTYSDFAAYWQKEYERRKNRKAAPKLEWAYLNFAQQFRELHPKASVNEIGKAWEGEHSRRVKETTIILDRMLSDLNG